MNYIKGIFFLGMIFIAFNAQAQKEETTHYVFPEFTEGAILMNMGTKYDALLNYNSLTKEMIFESEGVKYAIAKTEMGSIDTVFIQGRRFIPMKTIFIELVYQSEWELFIEHQYKMKEIGVDIGYGAKSKTLSVSSYSSLYSEGRLHDLKLPERYILEPNNQYWIKKNGEFTSFQNLRELRKIYKLNKKLFKAYVKEHETNFENTKSISELIEYLESN